MTADATRCAKCGGEFSRKRIHIDGQQYHEGCAIMSWPSHTHEDAQRMSVEIERLRAAIRWALGEAPDHNGHSFGDHVLEKAKAQPRYWWRTHLRALAGMGNLAYDKATRTIVDRANQQGATPAKPG